MDVFDFLRAKARMCRVHRDCAECPADGNCVTGINANSSNQQLEKVVAIVERWAAEHPKAKADEEHQQTYVLWWVSPSGQYYKYGEYESLKMAVQAYRYCRQAYAGFEPILKRLTSEDITEMLQKEHPPKTMLQDFLEKYPDAPLNINGDYPECCPFMLGYKKGDCIKPRGTCVECWNRPVE